jgi:hypothetical protein
VEIFFHTYCINLVLITLLSYPDSFIVWTRNAQHIAASNGNEHCVVLLLEYGVDPNIKGILSGISKHKDP